MTIEDIYAEVTKAAKSAARSWTGALDPEDVEQDMWVRIFGSPNTLPSLLSYEADRRGRVLRAIARQCAQAEVADREVFSANVTYSTDDIIRILNNGGACDIPGSTTHVEWMDVQAGLGVINPRYAGVLHSYYVVGDFKLSSNTEKSQLRRAREALTVAMNGVHKAAKAAHDGPGSRKAFSNATAQSLIRREGVGL